MLIEIFPASASLRSAGKRFEARITEKGQRTKFIGFGSYGSKTFIDHRDDKKRLAYIARHQVRETYTNVNAGSLSRYLLWEKPTLQEAARAFALRFGVDIVLKTGN